MTRNASSSGITRRRALRSIGAGIGAGIAAVPLAALPGCGDDGGSGGGGIDAPPSDSWASGGTAVMTGHYPDPFTTGGGACALLCETTLGPCYAQTVERKDISEQELGLPVRLAFRVVGDDGCTPIAGAAVDIWHTNRSGLYSGSDANGRVDFDTCFPGWYRGRTIHIHVQIRIGADEYVTTQLFFDDALTREIFAGHVEYEEFGQPDTTNRDDGVISSSQVGDYTLATQRMSDGAMLAYKTLVIRSSLATPACQT